jgi:hypothetical protein
MRALGSFTTVMLGIGVIMSPGLSPPIQAAAAPQSQAASPPQKLLHTHEEFEFVANATIEVVFPLFGAEAERAWAPDWNPAFLWPEDATDRRGMVFTVAHGDRTAIWVNTSFDPEARRVQYVYVIPGMVVTVITLKLSANGSSTHVAVTYERTALTSNANEVVSQMATHDRMSGPEWGNQVNSHLESRSQAGVPAGVSASSETREPPSSAVPHRSRQALRTLRSG